MQYYYSMDHTVEFVYRKECWVSPYMIILHRLIAFCIWAQIWLKPINWTRNVTFIESQEFIYSSQREIQDHEYRHASQSFCPQWNASWKAKDKVKLKGGTKKLMLRKRKLMLYWQLEPTCSRMTTSTTLTVFLTGALVCVSLLFTHIALEYDLMWLLFTNSPLLLWCGSWGEPFLDVSRILYDLNLCEFLPKDLLRRWLQ